MSNVDSVFGSRVRTGHCLCGSVSYRFDAEPDAVVLCHCGHCQRHSGAAFSVNVLVARDALEVKGTPRSYQTVGVENGNVRDRLFCGECGTPIFTILHERPGLVIVKAGTLDDPSGLRPSAEAWWRRAQDWIAPDPDRPRFDGDVEQRARQEDRPVFGD
ncbi:GFA family protein [Streptomyces sp. MC1]|uniref:GFA family protein n=1 Tax=Streptomyces sp. MC1 TaxID=295105 RepID=UPI0018CA79E7|nr:GFA family protein [Streptomyces sp. MC1]MBG7696548.1 GFA family protein [Streptomyces sp. MC1]